MTLKSSFFEGSPLVLFERAAAVSATSIKELLVRVTSRSHSPRGFEVSLSPSSGGHCPYRPYPLERSHEICPPMLLHVPSLLVQPSSGWESPCRFEGIQTCLRLLGKLSHI